MDDSILIHPKTDALLVIDVQPDFMEGGKLPVPGGRAVVGPINALMGRFQKKFATKDWHTANSRSFTINHADPATGQPMPEFTLTTMSYGPQMLWPVHCVQGTPGAELHPELRADLLDSTVLKGFRDEVDSYSGFRENDRKTETGMAELLREHRIKRVFVVGLTRPYCVDFTAFDAIDFGFDAYVVEGAVGELGARAELDASRARLEGHGVKFVSMDALVFDPLLWRQPATPRE